MTLQKAKTQFHSGCSRKPNLREPPGTLALIRLFQPNIGAGVSKAWRPPHFITSRLKNKILLLHYCLNRWKATKLSNFSLKFFSEHPQCQHTAYPKVQSSQIQGCFLFSWTKDQGMGWKSHRGGIPHPWEEGSWEGSKKGSKVTAVGMRNTNLQETRVHQLTCSQSSPFSFLDRCHLLNTTNFSFLNKGSFPFLTVSYSVSTGWRILVTALHLFYLGLLFPNL